METVRARIHGQKRGARASLPPPPENSASCSGGGRQAPLDAVARSHVDRRSKCREQGEQHFGAFGLRVSQDVGELARERLGGFTWNTLDLYECCGPPIVVAKF